MITAHEPQATTFATIDTPARRATKDPRQRGRPASDKPVMAVLHVVEVKYTGARWTAHKVCSDTEATEIAAAWRKEHPGKPVRVIQYLPQQTVARTVEKVRRKAVERVYKSDKPTYRSPRLARIGRMQMRPLYFPV